MSIPPDRAGHPGRVYHQLPMFMTAGELHSPDMKKGDHSEALDGPHDVFMGGKLSEADETGLTKNIQKRGLHTPIKVDWDKNTVIDGHHRIAAANSVDPNMIIPVQSVTPDEYHGASGEMTISEALRDGVKTYHEDNES